MPLYDYYCPSCSNEQEQFHGMTETPEIKCEKCGQIMKRAIRSGHGGFKISSGGTRKRNYSDRYGGKSKRTDNALSLSESAHAKALAQKEEKAASERSKDDPYSDFR